MLIESRGILDFNLENRTRKHRAQSSWKRTAIIKTNCDLEEYYAWFLEKRFNLKLNKTIRGSHISFINDRMDSDLFEQAAKVFDGKEISFQYDTEPRGSSSHWWLKIYCDDALTIRESIGLKRNPFYGLHLTLGYVDPKYREHNEYIIRQCIKFGLIL
jgi:hypothetical protein